MPVFDIHAYAERMRAFSSDAHDILGKIESSKSRRHTLDKSYSNLEAISLKQDDLFRQALRCVEVEVFRAAHVMAWAGLIDCLQNLCKSDDFVSINNAFPNWKIYSLDDLRETQTEFSLIDALHRIRVLTKSEKKALQGMLSKRNECAHPAEYFPSYNETLGYISEIFSRLRAIEKRFPEFDLASR